MFVVKPRPKKSPLPPPSKKRKATSAVEEVNFDFDARHEYLTGFHKRKQQRIKNAQEEAAKRERLEKLEIRKQVRRLIVVASRGSLTGTAFPRPVKSANEKLRSMSKQLTSYYESPGLFQRSHNPAEMRTEKKKNGKVCQIPQISNWLITRKSTSTRIATRPLLLSR
jgi:hypothetical protein